MDKKYIKALELLRDTDGEDQLVTPASMAHRLFELEYFSPKWEDAEKEMNRFRMSMINISRKFKNIQHDGQIILKIQSMDKPGAVFDAYCFWRYLDAYEIL